MLKPIRILRAISMKCVGEMFTKYNLIMRCKGHCLQAQDKSSLHIENVRNRFKLKPHQIHQMHQIHQGVVVQWCTTIYYYTAAFLQYYIQVTTVLQQLVQNYQLHYCTVQLRKIREFNKTCQNQNVIFGKKTRLTYFQSHSSLQN